MRRRNNCYDPNCVAAIGIAQMINNVPSPRGLVRIQWEARRGLSVVTNRGLSDAMDQQKAIACGWDGDAHFASLMLTQSLR